MSSQQQDLIAAEHKRGHKTEKLPLLNTDTQSLEEPSEEGSGNVDPKPTDSEQGSSSSFGERIKGGSIGGGTGAIIGGILGSVVPGAGTAIGVLAGSAIGAAIGASKGTGNIGSTTAGYIASLNSKTKKDTKKNL